MEGVRERSDVSALELFVPGDVTVHVVQPKDHWVVIGKHWMRVHILPRTRDYFPQMEEGGPDITLRTGQRTSFKSFVGGGIETVSDDYLSSLEKETSESWTTSTASGSYSSDSVMPKTSIIDRDDFVSSRPWDGEK
ncbi:MAG: hypothetical protein ACKPKO_44590, partial [Candidatus Fonsibacter sp.]